MAKTYFATQEWVEEKLKSGVGNLTSGKVSMPKRTGTTPAKQTITIPHTVKIIFFSVYSGNNIITIMDRDYCLGDIYNTNVDVDITFTGTNCIINLTNDSSYAYDNIYYYALS